MELSDDDRAAMIQATWDAERDGQERERIYLAGLRAGLERAAKMCNKYEEIFDCRDGGRLADDIRAIIPPNAA